MRGQLEDTVTISREITHGYYAGNLEPYLSRLCSKSVWLGTGGRVLIGGDTIRSRLEAGVERRTKTYEIFQEEYIPLSLTPRCQAVMGEVRACVPDRQDEDTVTASYTFLYQLIGTETKLVLLHANYEFFPPLRPGGGRTHPGDVRLPVRPGHPVGGPAEKTPGRPLQKHHTVCSAGHDFLHPEPEPKGGASLRGQDHPKRPQHQRD